MLLTIYENGENTTSFQTIFRDNVILPKFATLRLKNAFIGLNEVVNVATIQTFKFFNILRVSYSTYVFYCSTCYTILAIFTIIIQR